MERKLFNLIRSHNATKNLGYMTTKMQQKHLEGRSGEERPAKGYFKLSGGDPIRTKMSYIESNPYGHRDRDNLLSRTRQLTGSRERETLSEVSNGAHIEMAIDGPEETQKDAVSLKKHLKKIKRESPESLQSGFYFKV